MPKMTNEVANAVRNATRPMPWLWRAVPVSSVELVTVAAGGPVDVADMTEVVISKISLSGWL
jgi:hypothetical protein